MVRSLGGSLKAASTPSPPPLSASQPMGGAEPRQRPRARGQRGLCEGERRAAGLRVRRWRWARWGGRFGGRQGAPLPRRLPQRWRASSPAVAAAGVARAVALGWLLAVLCRLAVSAADVAASSPCAPSSSLALSSRGGARERARERERVVCVLRLASASRHLPSARAVCRSRFRREAARRRGGAQVENARGRCVAAAGRGQKSPPRPCAAPHAAAAAAALPPRPSARLRRGAPPATGDEPIGR